MPHQRFLDFNVTEAATWLWWLSTSGSLSVEIVAQTCDRLVATGIPLRRVRVGQRLIQSSARSLGSDLDARNRSPLK